MHLLVVIAFGLVMWGTQERPFDPPVQSAGWTLLVVLIQPVAWWVIARGAGLWAERKLYRSACGLDAAQFAYHRSALFLRFGVFGGFAAGMFLTRWPEIVHRVPVLGDAWGLGDLVVLAPLFLSWLAVWAAQYPIDRALRATAVRLHDWTDVEPGKVWQRGEYLSFHLRQQLLTVVVPMTLILFSYRLAHHFHDPLASALRFPWVSDAIFGAVVAGVFILSPVLLKTIWSTTSLPDGPLRQRLEAACERVGLRCRDILVWHSHGMMVNAAVMGLFAPFRYVLLSDALLEGMDDEGVEAVFGHEAGHVRCHHMQYFLLFALLSILLVSGAMELAVRWPHAPGAAALSDAVVEGIGLAVMALVWGVGFGMVSRSFERQADTFGARSTAPDERTCVRPCGVHPGSAGPPAPGEAICTSGAAVFVGALERVAMLNGIPLEERSWRHSSIAGRMRFLTAQAGDPATARAFRRRVRRLKTGLWVGAVAGVLITAVYCWRQPVYHRWIIENTVAPLRQER